MTKIIINKLEVKLNSQGQEIGGMTKYNKPWRILKVNGEYEVADFILKGAKEGDTIEAEIENGKYGKKIKELIAKEVVVPIDKWKLLVAKITDLEKRIFDLESIIRQ